MVNEPDFFSVVEREDGKYLVYTGYFYYSEDESESPYRYVEVNKGFGMEEKIPFDSNGFWERVSECRQTIADLTDDEVVFEMDNYYNGNTCYVGLSDELETGAGRGTNKSIRDVSIDTPCGSYWC